MEQPTPTLEQLEADLLAVDCVMARLESGLDAVCVRCRDIVDDAALKVLPTCLLPTDASAPSQLSLPTEAASSPAAWDSTASTASTDSTDATDSPDAASGEPMPPRDSGPRTTE